MSLMTKPQPEQVPSAAAHLTQRSSPRGIILQRIEAVAFGSPSKAQQIGKAAVDAHASDLRHLAES